MSEELPIVIRPMRADDVAFVRNSWARSYAEAQSLHPQDVRGHVEGHLRLIDRILARADVLVAAFAEDDSEIFGWVCHDPEALHYAYTKAAYRRSGVARRLLEEVGPREVTTHRTLIRHIPRLTALRFEPYRVFEVT